MSDLVNQNNPGLKIQGNTITIDTTLKVGLEQFKAHPDRRNGILSSLSQSIASMTGRKALPVRIENRSDVDMSITGDAIIIGQGHVDKALKWEEGGSDKAAAAIFGDVARAIAKRTGTQEIRDAISAAHGVVKYATKDANLRQSIANSIGSYVSVAPGINQLTDEFPGLSGAIMASFVMQADALDPREKFLSETASDRWRAAWTTMMAEVLCPDSVHPDSYPNDEIRDAIQKSAEALKKSADPITGKVDAEMVQEAVYALEPVFEGASDEENEEDIDASLDSDGEHVAVPLAPDPNSIGIGIDLGRTVQVFPAPPYRSISESPLTNAMREYLLDMRLENTPGQQTGRVNNQLHRIVTDQRVFSKRTRIQEAPDACVVIAVDFSGSMGRNTVYGTRLEQACRLHDAIVYALNELDIPLASCAYCGHGGNDSDIYPFNLPHSHPKARSAFSLSQGYVSGNGDVGAMLWSTKQIADSGAKKGAVIFLADGEVGGESAKMFRQRAHELDVSVFHVDYINAKTSPFGGEHIHAGGVSIEQIAEPLARGLAKVLDLE